jgi:hypothetical protein
MDPLLMPKITFGALQIVALGLGLYKMAQMGLLPTASSDWLAWQSFPSVDFQTIPAL